MKIANLSLLLKAVVTDKNGKVVSCVEKQARSFLIAFLQILEANAFATVAVSVKDYLGVAKTVTDHAVNFNSDAGSGLSSLGTLVGTGVTAVANDDNAIETPIGNGSGAGQLNYGAQGKVTTQEVGANVDFVMTRAFVNGSGGTINVTEFGWQVYGYASGNFKFLVIHDVIGAVVVNNGQTLTVTYTLRTTV